jgi:hypothetical protein
VGSFAEKAALLQQLRPAGAAIIERIVDAMLVEAEGRKL